MNVVSPKKSKSNVDRIIRRFAASSDNICPNFCPYETYSDDKPFPWNVRPIDQCRVQEGSDTEKTSNVDFMTEQLMKLLFHLSLMPVVLGLSDPK